MDPQYCVFWDGTLDRQGKAPHSSGYSGSSQLEPVILPTGDHHRPTESSQGRTRKDYLKAPPGGLVAHYREQGWTWLQIAAALHTHQTTARRAYEKWKRQG